MYTKIFQWYLSTYSVTKLNVATDNWKHDLANLYGVSVYYKRILALARSVREKRGKQLAPIVPLNL